MDKAALKLYYSECNLGWISRCYSTPLVSHFIVTSALCLYKVLRWFLAPFRHKDFAIVQSIPRFLHTPSKHAYTMFCSLFCEYLSGEYLHP